MRTNVTQADINGRLISGTPVKYFEENWPADVDINLNGLSNTIIDLLDVVAETVTIRNGTLLSLGIRDSKIKFLRFFKVDISSELFVGHSTVSHTFNFTYCNLERFTCNNLKIPQHNLAFKESTISKAFDFENSYSLLGIAFKECENIGYIRIMSSNLGNGSLSISGSTINSSIFIISGTVAGGIALYKSTFRDKFDCQNVVLSKNLSIRECDFERVFLFSHEEKDNPIKRTRTIANKVILSKSSFNDGFELVGNSVENNRIQSLDINCDSLLAGTINIRDVQIEDLKITGMLSNAEILISNIKCNRVYFLEVDNNSKIRLRKLLPLADSELSIVDSDMNLTYVNNINFRDFSSIRINNSTLRNIIYSYVRWPESIQVSQTSFVIPHLEKDRRYINLYRQLKQAAKNNHSKTDELYFEGKEWHYIEKYGQRDQKSKFWKFNDAFVLFFNRSNSFGTNWPKPLAFMIAANAILFALLLIVLDPELKLFCSSCDFAIGDLFVLMKEQAWLYLNLLNPTHNLKHFEPILSEAGLNPIISNWKAMTIDVLLRLSSGYFIYQMIVAFRKFSRK